MILLLDNYDSFTYNLAQYLEAHDKVVVKRNDELTLRQVERLRPDGIVISPGPGHPANLRDFGVCGQVVRALGPKIPTLGVCLGHQGIVHHFGGKVVLARVPMHGKPSSVVHDGKGLFAGLSNPLQAIRYHSLVADPAAMPLSLQITATAGDEIMGVRHNEFPIEGVQFHPESIGTPDGARLIANFMARVAGGVAP